MYSQPHIKLPTLTFDHFQLWLWYGKPTSGAIYSNMCDSRKLFKSKLKWCQNNKDQIQMDIIAEHHSNNNFRAFWKCTNKQNVRPGLPASVEGVSDSKEVADLFRAHFTVQSPIETAAEGLDDGKCGDNLHIRFSAKDVDKAIKAMSRGKSPGHDALSIEHLQHAGPHLPRVLAMLYTLCIGHGYLPPELMRTIVVPVVKNKTGDISNKNNYRPISLATIVAKVFDSGLNEQLNSCISLHDNQFGFKPKLSTESAILCLKHTVRYYTDRNTPVYASFLDLSRAFDLVSYNILWKKLADANLSPELVSIFRFWYGNQVNNVRWENELSDPYRLECGVRQGGLTSPTLFNLYINELIEELSSRHVGCHLHGVCVNNISYADDMVLLSASVGGLRELLAICEEYASRHGLIYNASKSELMVFKAGSKSPSEVPPVRLNAVPLKRVHKFKYLGHIVTEDLRDDADIERERRALSIRANMIARRFTRCSRKAKITLFRAYCTSLYTCSLWVNYTQRSYSALRVQYNNAFRVLLRLPRFCSASGMFADARVDCFCATMRKRISSAARRMRDSRNSLLALVAARPDSALQRHWLAMHAPMSLEYVL